MSVPVKPEPKYFLKESVNYADYLKEVFPNYPDHVTYLGEKSVSYYESISVAEQIKKLLPGVKILLILRNPVDRALSNYSFSVTHGLETRTPEEAFILNVPPPPRSMSTSVDPFDYIGRSDYMCHVPVLKNLFGEDLLILQFERLVNGLDLSQLQNFLNLKVGFELPEASNMFNQSERFIISDAVQGHLKSRFQPMIEELSTYLRRDFSEWNN